MGLIARARAKMDQLTREAKFQVNAHRSLKRYRNVLPYSINRRYDEYWSECKSAFVGDRTFTSSELDRPGFAVLPGCLSPDRAALLSGRMTRAIEQNSNIWLPPEWKGNYIVITNPLGAVGRDVFEMVDERAEAAVTNFFQSHFRILFLDAGRHIATSIVGGSFRWHNDSMPVPVISLFVYLTKTDEHGGGTTFLDADTSNCIIDAGYRWYPSRYRALEIEEFATPRGIQVTQRRFHLEPGDGVLWHNSILHKGIVPDHGYRDLITLLFVPNKRPWREQLAIDLDVLKKRFDRNEEGMTGCDQWLDSIRADELKLQSLAAARN
jgi:hypothetical protein